MFSKYLTPKGRLSCNQPQDIKNAWYIQKFKEVHGSKYDYSLVQYTTQHVKVTFICPIHGAFEQTPQNHLLGNGCKLCGKTFNTAQFIEKAELVHGKLYDYSRVKYQNTNSLVKILCKKHGEFLQSPNSHLRGSGCPSCQADQDFIYILKCPHTGLIKIGITKNLTGRLRDLGANQIPLLCVKVPDARALEKGYIID